MLLNLKLFGLIQPTFFAVTTMTKATMLLSSQLQLRSDYKSSKLNEGLNLSYIE